MRDFLVHAATIAKISVTCMSEYIKDYDKDVLTYVHVQSPCSQQALVYVNVFCLYKGFRNSPLPLSGFLLSSCKAGHTRGNFIASTKAAATYKVY